MNAAFKTISMVALATVAVSTSSTGQTTQPQLPRLVTSGEAQVRAAPDRATVFIGVQTRAITATVAGADNARRQKAILDTLKALGLGSDQLTTQNYSVSPEMKYDPNGGGNGKVTGYVVSNTVKVELKRIDQVGAVIDASLAKGANQITGVQFSLSTVADARRSAMSEAVKDARADAEVLARAAGGSVGQLIELTSSTPTYRPMFSSVAMESMKAGPQTPIEAGEQVISATVSAIWQFIPGK